MRPAFELDVKIGRRLSIPIPQIVRKFSFPHLKMTIRKCPVPAFILHEILDVVSVIVETIGGSHNIYVILRFR
jgi:hypothetical protein